MSVAKVFREVSWLSDVREVVSHLSVENILQHVGRRASGNRRASLNGAARAVP